MDISDLHYFTAAADAGSFSSSGKALGRDPSTLSRRIGPDIGDEVHRLPVRYSLTGGSPAGAMGAHKGRKRSTRLDGRSTALGRLRSILYRAEIGRSGRFADIRAGFPAPRFCGLQDFAFKVWWESRRCGMISARSRPESR
jgi:hypothetical protein